MKLIPSIKQCSQYSLFVFAISAAAAQADYSFQSFPLENSTTGTYDMEAGKILKLDDATPGTALVLVTDGVEQTIVSNAQFKSDVGIAGDAVFWTEFVESSTGDFAKELFVSIDGNISMLTSSGAEKEGFSYDAGTAAWMERINGFFELFYFDGSSVQQLTFDGDVVRKRAPNDRYIRMADGQIAFYASENNVSGVYLWNGLSVELASMAGVAAGFPDLDNGSVVFASSDGDSSEIFQWQGGTLNQLTDDNAVQSKSVALIENNLVAWTVSSSQFAQSLYTLIDGQSTLLSESLINVPVLDKGKIIWTEGEFGVPSRVVEFSAGQVTEITAANNPIGLDASAGFISWRENAEYPLDPFLVLATPEVSEQSSVTLAPLNSGKTTIDLSTSEVLVQIPTTNLDWTPASVKFGFTSADGLALDGIVVQGANGETFPLSAWWIAVSQAYSAESVSLIIPQQDRVIEVEWWFEG